MRAWSISPCQSQTETLPKIAEVYGEKFATGTDGPVVCRGEARTGVAVARPEGGGMGESDGGREMECEGRGAAYPGRGCGEPFATQGWVQLAGGFIELREAGG